MGTITTFDHTADVGLHLTGSDLDDLFRTAAEGLFDYIVTNRDDVRPNESETIELKADSCADLLVAWLQELLFQFETTHRLFSRFEVSVDPSVGTLRATVAGEPIDRERHVLDHEVKAVTEHGLSVAQSEDGWVAEVILDI